MGFPNPDAVEEISGLVDQVKLRGGDSRGRLGTEGEVRIEGSGTGTRQAGVEQG